MPMTALRRTRWNALLLFVVFVLVSQLLEPALEWLLFEKLRLIDPAEEAWRPSLFIWWEAVPLAAVLAATGLVAWLQRRSFASLGFATKGALRQMLLGALWGLGAPVALVCAIAALGGFDFGGLAMSGGRTAAYAFAWLVAFVLLGFAEEGTFRGAAQTTLGEAIGAWPAVVVISLIFGALHYFGKGPTETLADGLSVTLLGIFAGFTVIRTGSIWFAVGFHALYDDAALYLFGAPNSGNQNGQAIATKLLSGGYHGPAWLTGGPLGIEASWLAFPVTALLFIGFHVTTRRRPERESVAGS